PWSRADKDTLRTFFEQKEEIIFAEHFGSDNIAKGKAGYGAKCEAAKVDIFGKYLEDEITRAGFNHKQIAALFPSKTGGLTGCVSNWILGLNCPTREQYNKIREYLNTEGNEFLKKEYEDLKKEYEDLKREYESLRRPFQVTPEVPYTDVWDFPTVQYYEGKHPCEKPIEMHRHVIAASSRPGDVVLDCFGGSCHVADACIQLNRRYIIIEQNAEYCRRARQRTSMIQPEAAQKRVAAVPARLDRWAEAEG
ncbi:MAG: DNA methyltransferase, partial [Smithellaceae bacterium]